MSSSRICGAAPTRSTAWPVRVITQYAWHNLFVRNLFIQPKPEELADFKPEFVIIDCPGFHAFPEVDHTNSDVFILVNFAEKLVLIGGTEYGGEMKKSAFTAMNYFLPFQEVMPMHCSANIGPQGRHGHLLRPERHGQDHALGRPQAHADRRRRARLERQRHLQLRGRLLRQGDQAVARRESRKSTRRRAVSARSWKTSAWTRLTRRLDLNDDSLTENTRAAYPISHIPNATRDGRGGHPSNIVFLTADAFGVLPPIARLTAEQAMYHFISGYTAKVAGTERGVKEPSATFSACFGAPFMAQHPSVYAHLLGKKIAEHKAQVWLVNTGWTGGPYGVGSRMKLAYTRAMINAALNGDLDGGEFVQEPVFGLQVPTSVPDVPAEVLQPRNTWADKAAYDAQIRKLAGMFVANFKQYADQVSPAVLAAAPKPDA